MAIQSQLVEPDNQNRVQDLLLGVSQRIAVGEDELALQALDEVLQLEPGNERAVDAKTQIHLRLGGVAFQQKQYLEVRRHLHQILRLQSGNPRGLRLLRQVSVAEDRQKRLRDRRVKMLETIQASREHAHFDLGVKTAGELVALDRELQIPVDEAKSLQQEMELELRLMQEAERRMADAMARMAYPDADMLCDKGLERWPKASRFLVRKVEIEAKKQQTSAELRRTTDVIRARALALEEQGCYRNAQLEWEFLERMLATPAEAAVEKQRLARFLAEQQWEEATELRLDRLQELWASEDYIGAESALREIAKQAPDAPNLEHWRKFLQRARTFSLQEESEATGLVRRALIAYGNDPRTAARFLVQADAMDNYHPLTEPLLRQVRWLEPSIERDGTLGQIAVAPSPAPHAPPPPPPRTVSGSVPVAPPPPPPRTVSASLPVAPPPAPAPLFATSAFEASAPAMPTVSVPVANQTPAVPPKKKSFPIPKSVLVGAGLIAVLLGVGPELYNAMRKRNTPAPPPPIEQPPPKPVESMPPPKPLSPSMRIIADGPLQFKLDGQPVADVQAAGGPLETLAAGKHALEITSQGVRETISFEVGEGISAIAPPAVRTSSVEAVVLVRQAAGWKLLSSTPSGEIFIDEQPVGKLPMVESIPLTPGEHKFRLQLDTITKVEQQIGIRDSDVVAVWLRPLGTPLITVTTNVDKVQVFLNGRFYSATYGKQLSLWRLPAGKQRVRVQKDGYQQVNESEVLIQPGKTQYVKFELKPMPRLATLQIQTDGEGFQIKVDGKVAGQTDASGRFETKTIEPGERLIEISRPNFKTRSFSKRFAAGDNLVLSRADTKLDQAPGTLRYSVNPAVSKVTLRSAGAAERVLAGPEVSLPPGTYQITAAATGFKPRTETFTIEPGRTASVNLVLESLVAAKEVKPTITAPSSPWEGNVVFLDRGDGYSAPPAGVPYIFLNQGVFTGSIRFSASWELRRNLTWLTHFKDFQNHVRWELDHRDLVVTVVQNGKGKKQSQKHKIKDLSKATFRLNVQPSSVQLTLENPSWQAEPVAVPEGLSGKFGFSTLATKFGIRDLQVSR